MKKAPIVLLCISLLMIAGSITGTYFRNKDFSNFIKNVSDEENIMMSQLPEGTDELSQEDSNNYIRLKNEIREEIRPQINARNDTKAIISGILFHTSVDMKDITEEFQRILKNYETRLQPFFEQLGGFSIERDITVRKAQNDLTAQLSLIRSRTNLFTRLFLFGIYFITSFAPLILVVLFLFYTIFIDTRKTNINSISQDFSNGFLISGAIVLLLDAICYFIIQNMAYSIMRFVGDISLMNYTILLAITIVYITIGILYKLFYKKKEVK